VIVDLPRFVAEGRPRWVEFERALERHAADPDAARPLAELERFFELYESSAADLARLRSLAAPPEMATYLEALVARGYAEIHHREPRWRPRTLLAAAVRFVTIRFPRTFRRHAATFALSCAATVVGAVFGAAAVAIDEEAKPALLPFSHLLGDPAERVRQEETIEADGGGHAAAETEFSATLMTHNTRVAIFSLALGLTFGVGTLILLFYNGIVLGAVILDYLRAGQATFLAGWLLPHGVVEIPAFLIAGQAGLLLARTLLGQGSRDPLQVRVRAVADDLVALIGGVALLLVWAGVIEAFLSQIHEPRLPYAVKIAFGLVELGALVWWLRRGGGKEREESA
jgi:uncharacterized membrane protein SpoIIM required for sporulation